MVLTAPDALLQTLEARGLSLTVERDPGRTIDPWSNEEGTLVDDDATERTITRLHERLEELRYEPIEVLGEGGMGVVELARQRSLERLVALKSIKPEHTGPHARLKLLREAWITGRLEHPNIVPVHDLEVRGEGEPRIVLKRIEGTTWDALLASPGEIARRFGVTDPLEWNLRVLIDVARALHFAHTRGIVHRDLKPENVMIGLFGEVYVVDWGLAVSIGDDETGLLPRADRAMEIAGTPSYMAPEQWGSSEGVDARTDVYLLGATLYEILVGRPPREGATLLALAAQAMTPPTLPDDIPAVLAGIVLGAMQTDRGARYGSADAFRRAIEVFLVRRASIELAHEATQKADALEAMLEARPIDRVAIYQSFGAIRFGFLEALRTWDTNVAARRGLARAARAMLEFELRDGDPLAAQALLADLPADEALRERVEGEVRRYEAEQSALRATQREYDPNVGRNVRWWVSVVFGVVWTLAPIVTGGLRGHAVLPDTIELQIVGNLGLVLFAGSLFYWARDAMARTAMNRGIVGVIAVALAVQLLLSIGSWLAHPLDYVLVHYFAIWACAAGAAVATIDARLWPTMLAYGGVYLVGSWLPEHRYWLAAFGNAVLALNTTFLWSRPEEDLDVVRRGLRKLHDPSCSE